MWENCVVTQSGIALLGKLEAVEFSGAKFGISTVPAAALMSQKSVTAPGGALAITKFTNTDEGFEVVIRADNIGVSKEYTIKQVGIYAREKGTEGDGILFAIMQDEVGDRIPAESEIPDFSLQFTMSVAISNDMEITAVIDSSVHISRGEAIELINEAVKPVEKKIDDLPNLLDNWYFADPINQRGEMSYSGSGYAIDRWHLSTNGKIEINGSGVTITSNSSGTTWLEQYNADLGASLVGKTITGSLLLSDGTLLTCTGMVPEAVQNNNILISSALSANNCGLRMYQSSIESGRGLNFQISITANNSLSVVAAYLELSDKQTFARQDTEGNWILNVSPPNKALELAKCQRFYQIYKLKAPVGDASRCTIGIAHTLYGGDTVVAVLPKLPTREGVVPTVLFKNVKLIAGASTEVNVQSVTAGEITDNTASLAIIVEGNQAVGTVYRLRLWSADAYISLDVEIY